MTMEAFNDEMARQEYERAEHEYKTAEDMDCRTPWDIWLASWHCLLKRFSTKTFVPREPVVVHGTLPTPLPKFPHIIPERKP